jgi:hypothetical protein
MFLEASAVITPAAGGVLVTPRSRMDEISERKDEGAGDFLTFFD